MHLALSWLSIANRAFDIAKNLGFKKLLLRTHSFWICYRNSEQPPCNSYSWSWNNRRARAWQRWAQFYSFRLNFHWSYDCSLCYRNSIICVGAASLRLPSTTESEVYSKRRAELVRQQWTAEYSARPKSFCFRLYKSLIIK